jgi:hypothetical protein
MPSLQYILFTSHLITTTLANLQTIAPPSTTPTTHPFPLQIVLPFFFGPGGDRSPNPDLALFDASIVLFNASSTTISTGCQPSQTNTPDFDCSPFTQGQTILAMQRNGNTFINNLASTGVVDGTTMCVSQEMKCVFTSAAPARANVLVASVSSGGLSSRVTTVSQTVVGLDSLPVTAGAEKLAEKTEGAERNAGGGKREMAEGGSTFGLVVGLLAWMMWL